MNAKSAAAFDQFKGKELPVFEIWPTECGMDGVSRIVHVVMTPPGDPVMRELRAAAYKAGFRLKLEVLPPRRWSPTPEPAPVPEPAERGYVTAVLERGGEGGNGTNARFVDFKIG